MNTVQQTVVIQDVLEQAQFNQTTWNLLQALGINTVKEFEAFLIEPNEAQKGAIRGAAYPISGKARDLVAMAQTAYTKFKKDQADNVPINIDTLELYKNGKTRVAIRVKGTCEACFVPMRVLNALIAGDRLPEMVGVYVKKGLDNCSIQQWQAEISK